MQHASLRSNVQPWWPGHKGNKLITCDLSSFSAELKETTSRNHWNLSNLHCCHDRGSLLFGFLLGSFKIPSFLFCIETIFYSSFSESLVEFIDMCVQPTALACSQASRLPLKRTSPQNEFHTFASQRRIAYKHIDMTLTRVQTFHHRDSAPERGLLSGLERLSEHLAKIASSEVFQIQRSQEMQWWEWQCLCAHGYPW